MWHGMAYEAGSELASFDATGALERVRELVDGEVIACAEFTAEEYQVLYLSDWLEEQYGDVDGVLEVGDEAHVYSSIDFFEREAFGEMFPTVGEVRAFATFTDVALMVRVVGEDEGLYVSVPPESDATALVGEMEEFVAGTERTGVD
jgi:hypothetical protein